MSASFDWEKYETPTNQKTFDWEKYEKKQKPLTLKGAATSYAGGAAGGAGGLVADLAPLFGIVGSQIPKALGAKTTPELTEAVTAEMGGQEPQNALERILRQSGEFGGQEALIGTGLGGPIGGGAGLAHGSASGALYGGLKELGLDDNWALGITALATVSPIAAQKLLAKFKPGMSFGKATKSIEKELPKEPPSPPSVLEKGVPLISESEKLPSGLTKPTVMEAKHVEKAIISPERQEKAIQSLNDEAAKLARETIEKRVPKVKKIEEGYDFEGEFETGFRNLKKSINKYSPEIDVTDITDYLSKARKEYRGLPPKLLDEDAKKILSELKVLRDHPITDGKKLYKLFRTNNKKKSDIYERRILTGKQKEYVNHLTELNNAILKSFERSLPKDSIWLKNFKQLNQDYSEYQNALKTMKTLESVLNANAKPSTIAKLAENATAQKRLRMHMGKEGSEEIIQLAKDMKKARDAIKRIPTKKINEMDKIYPLGILIPGLKIPSSLMLIKKGVEMGRRIYGWYLTTPARRKAFDQAVKAVEHGDVEAYRKATDSLKKESPQELES